MQKIVYKSEFGRLIVNPDGEIVLEYSPLYLHSDTKIYFELVNFLNNIINDENFEEGNINGKALNVEMYRLIFDSFSEEQKQDFIKLINSPIYFNGNHFSNHQQSNDLKAESKLNDDINDYNNDLFDVCLN